MIKIDYIQQKTQTNLLKIFCRTPGRTRRGRVCLSNDSGHGRTRSHATKQCQLETRLRQVLPASSSATARSTMTATREHSPNLPNQSDPPKPHSRLQGTLLVDNTTMRRPTESKQPPRLVNVAGLLREWCKMSPDVHPCQPNPGEARTKCKITGPMFFRRDVADPSSKARI